MGGPGHQQFSANHRCGQPGQQHGRRIPSFKSEQTLSTCCRLVSSFLRGDRPADPLVPGKRRDVFPCRSCLRVRGERFAEISRKIVHDASGKSNSCHWIILPRFRFRPIIHFSLPQWALCPTYRSFIAMSGPPRLTTFPSKRETAATLTKPGKWKNHHPRRWACRAGHSLERKERISSDPFETPGYGRSWQPGESPRRCRQAAARR